MTLITVLEITEEKQVKWPYVHSFLSFISARFRGKHEIHLLLQFHLHLVI